jgi:hypothetical protein
VLKERIADGTALAGTFDYQQAVVYLARLATSSGSCPMQASMPTSLGLADDGLDARRLALRRSLMIIAS